MKFLTGMFIFLFLLSGCDFYSHSASASAWGRKIDAKTWDSMIACMRIVDRDYPGKKIKFAKAIWSGADDIPYGGIVYKIIDPSNPSKVFGYMLYARDMTNGPESWRLIIYEKTKEDFNTYCLNTPFYDFTIK